MIRAVLGTAGHIDHGKTSLIEALTGVNCDRLPQEKQRGITIDLGFAGLVVDDVQISFVDVPGHEKFVRNMLAGAGGIDAVIVVVAADESVMPQTEEHLEICRILGVAHAMVALTKIDLVDQELRDLVELEVSDRVSGVFREQPEVVPVSVRSGEGIDRVRIKLVELARKAAQEREARRESRIFRLPIDRVFGMKGFGTVVTGTVTGGSLSKDEPVEILPRGERTRVRALQVHHGERDEIQDGERASVNLSEVATDQISRGFVLAAPGRLRPSRLLTCSVEATESEELRAGERLHVHLHSNEVTGTLRLIGDGRKKLRGGDGFAWAQIHLDESVVAVAGDRFVVRSWSPMRTVGGGVIIDPHLKRLRSSGRKELLEGLGAGSLETRLEWMAREAKLDGVSLDEVVARTGLEADFLREELRELPKTVLGIGSETWLHLDHVRAFRRSAMELLQKWFDANEISTGMPKSEFLQKLIRSSVGDEVRSYLMADLEREGIAEVRAKVVDIPGRDTRPGGRMGALAAQIERIYSEAGLNPPSDRDVTDQLSQKREVVRGVMSYLAETGSLVRLSEGLYVHHDTIHEVRGTLSSHSGELIDVRWFKEKFGLTRKLAIPLLEHLDQEKVTLRIGDQRRIS